MLISSIFFSVSLYFNSLVILSMVWVISEHSPLAMAILTKKIKDTFEFNGIKYKISKLE